MACKFVADVHNKVVQTSVGTVVHTELRNIMRVQTVSHLSASVTISQSRVLVAVYTDRHSLTCACFKKKKYCDSKCWKKMKRAERLLKLQSYGANASNNWVWGEFVICPDDISVLVCSDSFSI